MSRLRVTTDLKDAIQPLRRGGLAVLPTDTVYGVVGRAADSAVIERLYTVRQRDPAKPFILLIADEAAAESLGIVLTAPLRQLAATVWPGPTSLVVPCANPNLIYLHRGQQSLALRVPADGMLRELLQQTGPLAAPSANPESRPPATTASEARTYFGNNVDIYIDGGTRSGKPSRLLAIGPDGATVVLRP